MGNAIDQTVAGLTSATGVGTASRTMVTSGGGVNVAVLDTWPVGRSRLNSDPAFGRIAEARARVQAAGGDTSRLDQVLAGELVVGVRDLVGSTAGTIACCHVRPDGTIEEPYDVSDHGLFVADIIKDIAPEAVITVYRVLDDHGIGDLATVARAMEHALAGAERDGAPLIANLSLGFAPELLRLPALMNEPTAAYRQGEDWLRQNAGVHRGANGRDPATTRAELTKAGLLTTEGGRKGVFGGPLGLLEHLFSPTRLPDNVLVVAAAGNDSHRPRGIADPRLPASIEGVLGVSAATRAGAFAAYSNADDLFSPDDGIGAFGGDVDPATGDTREGLIGLYVSEKFPSGEDNKLGWAEWAGTSFAAPVVTGIAACTWPAMGVVTTGQALMSALVSRPSGAHPPAFTVVQQ